MDDNGYSVEYWVNKDEYPDSGKKKTNFYTKKSTALKECKKMLAKMTNKKCYVLGLYKIKNGLYVQTKPEIWVTLE